MVENKKILKSNTINHETVAYFSYADKENALQSLRQHVDQINVLIPTWFRYDNDGKIDGPGFDPEVSSIANGNKTLQILPLLSNYDPSTKAPNSKIIHSIISNPEYKSTAITNTVKILDKYNLPGVNLDIEAVLPSDRNNFSLFITDLYKSLNQNGKLLYISLPAKTEENVAQTWSGAFDYNILGKNSDRIIVMAYNESWSTSNPGPIEDIDYTEKVIKYTLSTIDLPKISLGIGLNGLDWISNSDKPAETLTYASASSKILSNIIVFPGSKRGSYVIDGVQHIVWFEDANTFKDKVLLVNKYNLRSVSLWSLGNEDVGIWSILKQNYEKNY